MWDGNNFVHFKTALFNQSEKKGNVPMELALWGWIGHAKLGMVG